MKLILKDKTEYEISSIINYSNYKDPTLDRAYTIAFDLSNCENIGNIVENVTETFSAENLSQVEIINEQAENDLMKRVYMSFSEIVSSNFTLNENGVNFEIRVI